MAARRTFGGRVTAAQWERLKPLFDEAIDLPVAERAEFLVRLRAEDAEIAARLGSLLEQEGTTATVSEPLVHLNDFLPAEKHFFKEGEVVIGRFRIVRFLGRGGMGEVYHAEDMQLGDVALKTLRPGVALGEDSMLRFRQEVQLARRVTSTNVCRIHDLFLVPGDSERLPCSFLTMELLAGVTMAEQIESEGPLPFAQAQSIALHLCAALQAIHDAGVIHRDFKSRNIMLVPRENGLHAVVMDLGLARDAKPSGTGDSGITMTGAVMGTPEYMSPEQFQGAAVTPAADIYALGIVLYELVTGIRPFQAATPLAAAVMRAKHPASASSVRAGVPKQWDKVIDRCLEFEPEKRWASARQVAEALATPEPSPRGRLLGGLRLHKSVLSATSLVAPDRLPARLWRRSTVILASALVLLASLWFGSLRMDDLLHPLPQKHFVALMSWPDDTPSEAQPLLRSILNTIDNRLAREEASSKNLLLISADASGQQPLKQPSDAVEGLGANLVLAASLRPNGSGAALNLQVLEASTGRPLRHLQITSPVAEFKSLPQKASNAAAQLLDIRLSRSRDKNEMADVPAQAFTLFNRAEDLISLPNDAGIQNAIEKYEKALELDPKFALAYARLSMALIRVFRQSQDSAALRLAGRNADLALRYNPDSAKSVLARAAFDLDSGNTPQAMEEFGKALQIEPGNPEILLYKARAFRDLDRAQDEENVYKEIIRQRPNFWPAYNDLGSVYYRHGQYAEAASILAEGTHAAPGVAVLLTNLGTMYLELHKTSEAEIAFQRSLAIAPNEFSLLNLGSIAFEAGDYRKALEYYSRARDLKPANSLMWRNIADCYAMLGQTALAARSYGKAAELLSTYLQTNPRRGSNWMNLAFYESKLGHRQQAEADIRKAEERGAADLESRFIKAQTLAVLGRKSEAVKLVMDCLNRGLSIVEVNLAVDLKDLRSTPEFRNFVSKMKN